MTRQKSLIIFIAGFLGFALSASAGDAVTSVLQNYSSKVDEVIQLPEIGGNLSGITYNPDTGTYFMIQNKYKKIFEYDRTLKKQLRKIELTNLVGDDDDTEDIVYLGSGMFAINAETNRIFIFHLGPAQTVVDLKISRNDVQMLQLPDPDHDNNGVEGLCYSVKGGTRGTFWAAQEKRPKMVWTFPWPASNNDITSAKNLNAKEFIDAEKVLKHRMSDLSSCTFVDGIDHLLLLSHESSRIMEFDRSGQEITSLDLPAVVPQYEGITFGPEGQMVLVSEPNAVVIIRPK